MKLFLVGLIGYILGCIHGSQLIGKYKSINIKNAGTKNAGATNTTILLGWKYGFVVAFIDVFKAILSISFILLLLNNNKMVTNEIQIFFVYLNALFVIIGHNYPVTMNFKGGKGTAAFIGMILMINWKMAITGLVILLLIAWITDYLAIGLFFMYISFITFSYYAFGYTQAMIACLLLMLSMIKHIDNYKRIVQGAEIRLSSFIRSEVS